MLLKIHFAHDYIRLDSLDALEFVLELLGHKVKLFQFQGYLSAVIPTL